MTKVIGYIRVSTEQQVDDGASLEAQRIRLQAYALATELELVEIVEDAGISAKTLQRPGIQRVLAALKSGKASGVIVTKLDRLTRSVVDLNTLITDYFGAHYQLLSVGDSIDTRTAAGRLMLNILASVSQWEREAIAERTRDALGVLKGQGVTLGAPRYGTRKLDALDTAGRRITVSDEVSNGVIARIVELSVAGMSARAIARHLTCAGIKAPAGGRDWHAKTVCAILRRNERSVTA